MTPQEHLERVRAYVTTARSSQWMEDWLPEQRAALAALDALSEHIERVERVREALTYAEKCVDEAAKAEAENEWLREALREIARTDIAYTQREQDEIARAALERREP